MYTKIEVFEAGCEKCGHVWQPRGEGKPRMCPVCKSMQWDSSNDATVPVNFNSDAPKRKPKAKVASIESPKPVAVAVADDWTGWSEERTTVDLDKGEIIYYREHLKTRKRKVIRTETDW